MKANFQKLDQLAVEGFVRRVVSDDGRLVLYNYTDKCTYERKWDRHTLGARGTVYELATGKVVAKAFDKFFNFGELKQSKARNILKRKEFETFEKMDGSLGVIYFYSNQWHVNTRGSFSSEQAMRATDILHNMENFNQERWDKCSIAFPNYDILNMNDEYTYLVEIIYPENKIIVDYGQEHKLVLLAMIHTESEEELPYDMMAEHAIRINMPCAAKYEFNSIDELITKQSEMGFDEEGFVVKVNGERVKFKSLEYLKVARAMSHMTPIHFWKNMQAGGFDAEFLAKFPEELSDGVEEIVGKLETNYGVMKAAIVCEFEKIKKTLCPLIVSDKKSFCKHIGQNLNDYKHPNALFAIINGDKDKIDGYIMKKIRPDRNEL